MWGDGRPGPEGVVEQKGGIACKADDWEAAAAPNKEALAVARRGHREDLGGRRHALLVARGVCGMDGPRRGLCEMGNRNACR